MGKTQRQHRIVSCRAAPRRAVMCRDGRTRNIQLVCFSVVPVAWLMRAREMALVRREREKKKKSPALPETQLLGPSFFFRAP